MEERIILEDKKARLTTEMLTIKGESFKLSEIESAEALSGFFNIGLKIRFVNGTEKVFKRFISVPSSMAFDAFCSYGSSTIAYITSRLQMWAAAINAQIHQDRGKNTSRQDEINELKERIRRLEKGNPLENL